MNTKNRRQILILFIAGISLIALSSYFAFFSQRKISQGVILGKVERESGKSYLFSSGFNRRELIDSAKNFFHQDSIETLETGEVKIFFENGYILKLETNSLLTVEKNFDSNETLVTLSRGDLQVQKLGRDPLFYISQNGHKVLATNYSREKLVLQSGPAITPIQETVQVNRKTPLSEEEIHTLLNGQRPNFFKCYAQLLQLNPEAKGMLTLNFMIDAGGKVQHPSVNSQDLQDISFQKCLIESLKRLEFRSFEGPSVSTLFPMKFE